MSYYLFCAHEHLCDAGGRCSRKCVSAAAVHTFYYGDELYPNETVRLYSRFPTQCSETLHVSTLMNFVLEFFFVCAYVHFCDAEGRRKLRVSISGPSRPIRMAGSNPCFPPPGFS